MQDDGQLVYDKGPNLLMSEVTIGDGIGLGDLIKRARPDFRKQLGTVGEDWWSAFDYITLVRERRYDPTSRVGVLVDDDLAQRADLEIYKTSVDNVSTPFTLQEQEFTFDVPSSATVVYGFEGYKNSFGLKLSEEVVDDNIWGQIVHVTMTHPQYWPLPPKYAQPQPPADKDFIITSSTDYIPLDGYFIDIGESPHTFYAKAKLTDALDAIEINDGKNSESDKTATEEQGGGAGARKFPLDKAASLGDFQQGILITLVQARAAVSYTGLIAAGLLLINALFFTVLIRRQHADRLKLFLTWTLIWGGLLTILTLRLILAYRVSLLPPFDASLKEIQNIFDKGVKYSLYGLGASVVLILALLALPLITGIWQRIDGSPAFKKLRESKVAAIIIASLWGVSVVTWIIAGKYLGTNQAFLFLRINTATYLLIMFGLVLLAKHVTDTDGWLIKALLIAVTVAAIILQIAVVKDTGAVIYGISLILCMWLVIFWESVFTLAGGWLRRIASLLIATIPVIIVFAVLFLPHLLLPYVTQSQWMRKNVRPAFETAFYRFASFTDSEESILTARSGDEDANLGVLLNNTRQDWQMLLYASHGASRYTGYGQTPLSKRGMTYATSVTDCAFATYLLAEHGKAAGLFLLLLYLLIGCACLFAGWYLPEDLRHRTLPLVAIGGFLACNALYMAGANVGLMVFTGQNMPLLGLNSGSDLLQGLVVIGLAGFLLLTAETESDARTFASDHQVAAGLVTLFALSLVLWAGLVVLRMVNIGKEERYRRDLNFSEATFDRIKGRLPPSDDTPGQEEKTPWQFAGDQLVPKPGVKLDEIEEQYAKQLNDRADKFSPSGGLYYLERSRNPIGGAPYNVKVNDRYFFARSPFNQQKMWRGTIVASGTSDPTIYALGGASSISLENKGYPASIDLSQHLPMRVAPAVLLTEDGRQFCELKRSGDQLRLDPKSRMGEWAIYVDGKQVKAALNLQPMSIIVIEWKRKDERLRRNLIYLGPTPPILAFVQWRNGEQRRLLP